MAEIHVQAKKHQSTPAWIWIIVGLLIAAVVIYFVTTRDDKANDTTVDKTNTTSYQGAVILEPAAGFIVKAA